MSLLLSARISAGNALEATRALIEAGLTTPQKMARATWQRRVDVITWHGYKRYDERTSTMLDDTAGLAGPRGMTSAGLCCRDRNRSARRPATYPVQDALNQLRPMLDSYRDGHMSM